MAASGINIQYLQQLRSRAEGLVSACRSLDSFLADQSAQLQGEADIERLNILTDKLKRYLSEAERSETGAYRASKKADALGSIIRLAVDGIGMAMGEKAFVNGFDESMQESYNSRQHCFGFSAICVGRGGLPDDVRVVSISELAREKNLPESEIVLRLERNGELVFRPEDFWRLVEGLIVDITSGQARLPIILPQKIAVKKVCSKSHGWVPKEGVPNSGSFKAIT
ncbi:hypothetical protein ACFLT3_01155 [Chloroflexota bacterium]